jgi:hypothetical protein
MNDIRVWVIDGIILTAETELLLLKPLQCHFVQNLLVNWSRIELEPVV